MQGMVDEQQQVQGNQAGPAGLVQVQVCLLCTLIISYVYFRIMQFL